MSPLAVPNDLDDGGFLPGVSIDRTIWAFCLNNGPVPASPPPQIFLNDTLQDPSVYAFNPAVNHLGLGVIAAVQFAANPGARRLSWRGLGTTLGVSGPLITNPLTAIADAFGVLGGWTLNDFDLAISVESQRTLDNLGLDVHWVFHEQRTYREWLMELLRCYHIDFFQNHQGQLALQLDKPIYGLPVSVVSIIDAQIDLVGTQDAVEYEVDEANIINTLKVKRRLKWVPWSTAVRGQERRPQPDDPYTDVPTVEHRASINQYGILRDQVELPACYTDLHTQRWVNALFSRYAHLPAIVRFSVRGLAHLTTLPGTYVGFIWPLMGWTQPRLLKVLNQEVDVVGETPSVRLECFDCQRFVEEAALLPETTITSVRRRIRLADRYIPLEPPAAASGLTATGAVGKVILTATAPLSLDYDHMELWMASTNNRATATFQRNLANQVRPGESFIESFDLTDFALHYVWLMTVDTEGNGRNGTGNWHPTSATAGVVAQATTPLPGPVDTIAPAAASGLVASPSFGKIFLTATTPPDADYDHLELWTSLTNNRATATFRQTMANQVRPSTTWTESYEVSDTVVHYVWLMAVDTSGNGAGGTGNWHPLSATAGVLAQAALIYTADTIAPAAASGLTSAPDYAKAILTATTPADVDFDHMEVWLANSNNRAAATFYRNVAQRVRPGSSWRESIDLVDNVPHYVWLMTVDTAGNGRNGTGNWHPTSATAGVLCQASADTADTTPPAAATGLVTTGSYRRIVVRWNASSSADYAHTEIWAAANTNNRASAVLSTTGGVGVSPGGPCEVTYDLAEGDFNNYYFWLMSVDTSGNGKGGTGNWFPASATAGVLGVAVQVNTPGIETNAVTVVYPTGTSITGANTGEAAFAATALPATPAIGSFVAWSSLNVTVPPQGTMVTSIREGSIAGPRLGQVHTYSPFTANAILDIITPGAHFNPVFGVTYYLVANCLSPGGAQVSYTVNGANLLIQHTKK